MEDAQIILERHEQRLKTLERDVSGLKAVQTEIRMMNLAKPGQTVGDVVAYLETL